MHDSARNRPDREQLRNDGRGHDGEQARNDRRGHDGEQARNGGRGCRERLPIVLTIGGSDPSGGAGIQADLKTVHAMGGYALSVVTAITAQSSHRVSGWEAVGPEIVGAQLRALAEDFSPDAVKTGMLAGAATVSTVGDFLKDSGWHLRAPLVVDPVLASTSGRELLDHAGREALREKLLPLAFACTPNWPEAAALTGIKVVDDESAARAGKALLDAGAQSAIVTGGHGAGEASVDVLVTAHATLLISLPRVGVTAHGTGCAFASALAVGLAQGLGIEEAARRAKDHVARALISPLLLGQQSPILDPFGFRS